MYFQCFSCFSGFSPNFSIYFFLICIGLFCLWFVDEIFQEVETKLWSKVDLFIGLYKRRKANKDKDKNLAKAIFRDKCCHKKPPPPPPSLLALSFIIFPTQFTTKHKSFRLRDVFSPTYGIYVSGNKFAPIYVKF